MKKEIYSRNLKQLRANHNLSNKDFCSLLGVKSTSNIAAWESGTAFPVLDVLFEICSIFGVSSDWLFGFTTAPYNEEWITACEDNLFNTTLLFDGKEVKALNNQKWLVPEYRNVDRRRKTYSLAVRANIVYLLHIYISELDRAFEISEIKKMGGLKSKIFDIVMEARFIRHPDDTIQKQKKRDYCLELLHNMLEGKDKTKVQFDITSPVE